MLAILVPLLLAAVAPSAEDRSALEERTVEIFRPYTAESDGTAAWDYPIYSAEVTALIANWSSVRPEGEVDDMSDGDWLCQCQDWDSDAFSATITSIEMTTPDVASIEVSLDLGFSGELAARPQRMIFLREGGAWKLDDVVSESFPEGIKQGLRDTIAEDRALAGERG